jgi:ribonuclease R
MLPKTLTKNISLTADGESLAHTVLFAVDANTGEILNSKRCHSRIQVNKRMTFDEVQQFIDGSLPKDWDDKIIKNMRTLVDITEKMRAFRKKTEKFLELATSEIRVLCDFEKKEIIGLERRTQKQADQLVEECMLAANAEVAKELISRSIPAMFRVHPEPDPEKLEDFYTFVSKTFGFFPGDLSSRSACNHFLANLPDDHKRPIIIGAFLRSLPRASYKEENEFHFGLGKGRYCHFTSPIRRYPDLAVHQQLWTFEAGGRLRSKKTVAKYAEECSAKEMKNDEAYYSANDRLKLKYLDQENEKAPSSMYEAVITKISSAGLLVDVVDLGIFGFVPIESLGGRYKYKKKESTLKESRGGHQSFKCGDFIFLHLDRIDFIRATAVFRPVR